MRDDAPSIVLSFVGYAEHAATEAQCLVEFAQHRDAAGRCWLEASFAGVAREAQPLRPAVVAWWEDACFPPPSGPGPGPGPGPGGGCEAVAAITTLDGTPALGPVPDAWRRRARAEMRERLAATRAEVERRRAEMEARRARTAEMRAWLADLRGAAQGAPVVPTPIRAEEYADYEAMAAD